MSRLLVALALLGGCKTVAKGDQFEDQLVKHFESKSKGHTVAIDCPDHIPLGMVKDNHFDCAVAADDGSNAVITVHLDAKGEMSVSVK